MTNVYKVVIAIAAVVIGFFVLRPTPTAASCGAPANSGNQLTDEKLKKFYTLHEGADMLPVSMLRKLRVWEGKNPVKSTVDGHHLTFMEVENLKRYGLIENPYAKGTMIGLSVSEKGRLGINCAACHTNQLIVNGKPTKILDGAPSVFDTEKFALEMYLSLTKICKDGVTSCEDGLLAEFKVLAGILGHRDEARAFLEQVAYLSKLAYVDVKDHPYPFGPGRIDDFGGARDVLWPASAVPLVGPSSIIDLWSFQGAKRIHWDLNMNSTFDRNLGQAITGGATYGGYDGKGPVSVKPCEIAELDSIAKLMTAPKWENSMPDNTAVAPLPQEKVLAQGKKVFDARCASCHAEKLSDHTIPISETGTDPNRALVYFLPMKNGVDFRDFATKDLLRIKRQVFKAAGLTPDPKNGTVPGVDDKGDDAQWFNNGGYVPRPLKGIWASPPYLHNGSVLTLAEVLNSKARKYPDQFQIGHRDYDTVNVGLVRKDCIPGDTEHFCFDTRLPGNSNAGHTFGDALSDDDRKAVIEYLKTR